MSSSSPHQQRLILRGHYDVVIFGQVVLTRREEPGADDESAAFLAALYHREVLPGLVR
jgi:hypothetical protein